MEKALDFHRGTARKTYQMYKDAQNTIMFRSIEVITSELFKGSSALCHLQHGVV